MNKKIFSTAKKYQTFWNFLLSKLWQITQVSKYGFRYSDWIRRFLGDISVFCRNTRRSGPEKLHIGIFLKVFTSQTCFKMFPLQFLESRYCCKMSRKKYLGTKCYERIKIGIGSPKYYKDFLNYSWRKFGNKGW